MEPDWGVVIAKAYARNPERARYSKHATEAELVAAERALKRTIPPALRSLLARSNGVAELLEVKGRKMTTGWLVWNLKQLVAENTKKSRAKVGPPASWFLFMNPGVDGIVVGHDLAASTDHVYAWHANEQRKQLLAKTFQSFIERWGRGTIKL